MAFITENTNPDLFSTVNRATKTKINKIGNVLEGQIQTRKEAVAEETASKEALQGLAKQAYFEVNDENPGGAPVHTFDFGGLQVNFTNSYRIRDKQHADELVALLGQNHPLAAQILTSTVVNTNVDKLMDSPNSKQFVAYAKELSALNKRYGVQSMVDDTFAVSPAFHDMRHTLLTPEDNLEVDKVLPMTVAFSLIEG